MSYTPDQSLVIAHPNDNNLVIALPGSGKTHTSIGLAQTILESSSDHRLIMVTFTRASTGETESRVAKNLSASLMSNLRVDTFAKIMMDHAQPLLNGRKLIMGGEHEIMKRRAVTPFVRDKMTTLDMGLGYLGSSFVEDYLASEGELECMWPMGQKYLSLLAQYRKVDLTSLTVELIFALRNGTIEPIDFTHMIVDEFQDTDLVQLEWLKANYREGRAITVVGDDDQSIYSWRGARAYLNMVEFKEFFNSNAWLLGDCFRCAPEVLQHAERMISYNPSDSRIAKVMNAVKPKGGKVEFLLITDDQAEAAHQEILQIEASKQLEKSRSENESDPEQSEPEGEQESENNGEAHAFIAKQIAADPHGWAVLARTNMILDGIQRALEILEVPVARIGGRSIWEHSLVVGYMSLLALLFDDRKVAALDGALHFLDIEDREIGKIHRLMLKAKRVSMIQSSDLEEFSKGAQKKMAAIGEWARAGTALSDNQDEIKNFLVNEVRGDLLKVAGHLRKAVSTLNFIDRILISTKGTPRERIAKLNKRASSRSKKADPSNREVVILCTMSGSKGLEFPNVWIADCERGRIPIKAKYIIDEVEEKNRIEEERRLLYVAMTRAENRLVMSYREGRASYFLSEAKGYQLHED